MPRDAPARIPGASVGAVGRGAVDDSGNPIYIIDKTTGKKRQATYGELGPKTKRVK